MLSVKEKKAIVAIVGRPNVGKSTLFNRLVGRRMALVYDEPGVTRDRKEALAHFGGESFYLVDTPGLFDPGEGDQPAVVTEGMRKQALQALTHANVILFVIDGKLGCTPYDQDLAQVLRQQNAPVIVLVNKSEGREGGILGLSDAHQLGFEEVIPISAEHGLGMGDLQVALAPYVEQEEEDNEELLDIQEEEDYEQRPLKLAIMGRPNVGKSTLVNTLLGTEAQLTADYPGVTRDAISFRWRYKDREIELVDTAGIRRRNKVSSSVEKLAIFDAERTLQFAEVVVLVIDASIPKDELIEKQDLSLASQILEEGRALILALNKWDKVKDPSQRLSHIREQLDVHLSQGKTIPCVPLSALKGNEIQTLMNEVLKIEKLWNRRISTADLNKWLKFTIESHPAPIVGGFRIKLKYITQIKTRPPTFKVFCTKGGDVPESYTRYLINTLRKDFNLPSVPIRLQYKTQKNPYGGK